MKNEIISILMCRDDMTREEAINIIEETRDEIACAIENGAGLDEIEIRATSLTPLGEINLPFVASNAFIPRCRRNRCSFRVGARSARSSHPAENTRRTPTARAKRLAFVRFVRSV